ncbi:MAG: DUF4097 and DUF4098 domain-containing protein YvlB [Roseivirga sp.]|jgi:DUF4097 and DUF4098 domain-containing protein YvlB
MKKLIILLLFVSVNLAFGQLQVIQKSYPYNGQKLDFDMDFGTEVIIKSWDKNEISVKLTYVINEGKQNDLMDLKINNSTGLLEIDVDVEAKKSTQNTQCCCVGRDVNHRSNGKKGNRLCAEIKVEIFLPRKSDIKVKTILARVFIDGFESNLEVETVTGDIILNWSEKLGADLLMRSTIGAIYTDFELQTQSKKGLPLISGHKFDAKYKNGRFELRLKTVTSDISFKKANT